MARTKRVSKARKGSIRGKGRRVQSKRVGKKRTKRSSKSSSRSNKRMRRSFIKKSRGRSRRSLRRMRGGASAATDPPEVLGTQTDPPEVLGTQTDQQEVLGTQTDPPEVLGKQTDPPPEPAEIQNYLDKLDGKLLKEIAGSLSPKDLGSLIQASKNQKRTNETDMKRMRFKWNKENNPEFMEALGYVEEIEKHVAELKKIEDLHLRNVTIHRKINAVKDSGEDRRADVPQPNRGQLYIAILQQLLTASTPSLPPSLRESKMKEYKKMKDQFLRNYFI